MLYATPLTFLSLRRSAVALRSAVGSSLGARVKTAQKARTAAVRTRSSTSSRRSWSMAEGARREGGGDEGAEGQIESVHWDGQMEGSNAAGMCSNFNIAKILTQSDTVHHIDPALSA